MVWSGLVREQRGRTWPGREALEGALRYGWGDGLGRGLTMDSPEGWEGLSWLQQRALV